MDMSLFPLLATALILWFGFFVYMLFVDRGVARLERRVAELKQRREEKATTR